MTAAMPPRKRRRQSADSHEARHATSVRSPMAKHELFAHHARSQGIFIGSVHPASLTGRGVGLVATATIEKDECVLFVPEKAMFKPKLDLVQSTGGGPPSTHAQLTLSLMVSLSAGGRAMQLWEATWPTFEDVRDSIPYFWDKDLLKLLPPSASQMLARQRDDFQRDLEHPSINRYLAEHRIDRDKWPYYWFLINSRCFYFKPLGSQPASMVMCPFADYLNHGPTGSGCNVRQTSRGYEVSADRRYDAGEELLATYGASSNEKLLVNYGFVCSSEIYSDDNISLDHLILPRLNPDMKERLRAIGYLGGYALLPATKEICFRTQVAIRAALLSIQDVEYFAAHGEDSTSDQSLKVVEWLEPSVDQYRAEAQKRLAQVRTCQSSNKMALATLRSRWTQITGALDAFLRSY